MFVHDDALQQAAAQAQLEENPTALVESMVEEAAGELNEAVIAADASGAEVVKIAEVSESLESFIHGIFDQVPAAEWNSKIARQYQVGVGSIFAAAGVSMAASHYSASFEDAGKEQTNEENRTESETKGKNIVKRMWDAFLKALQSLANNIMLFAGKVGKNAAACRKAGENLWARAKKVKGTPKKDTFDGAPAWGKYLYKNGSQGKASAAVASATYELMHVAVPTIDAYSKMAEIFSKAVAEGDVLDDDKFSKDLKDITEEAGPLFGGQKLELEVSDDKLLPTLKAKITKEAVSVKDVKVLSITEINELGKSIVDVADGMEKVESSVKTAVKDLGKIRSNISKAAHAGTPTRLRSSQLSGMISNITSMSKVILPYAAGLVQDAYSHGSASLKMYKGDEPAVAEGKGGDEKEVKKEEPKAGDKEEGKKDD
jgi:hypothetical protein